MTGWWGFVVVGLLVPLVLNEAGDLGSWIARRLLSWGARRLGSPEKAERYSEEWMADLERVPGKLTKVAYAFGVVAWGVPRMRLHFARQQRRRLSRDNTLVDEVAVPAGQSDSVVVQWEGLTGSERYAACLWAAKKGNRQALATLVEDLTPLVWHVARGNDVSRHAAEDVVQNVWGELFEHVDTIDDPQALAGWLITTTRRRARQTIGTCEENKASTDEYDQVLRENRDDAWWRAFYRLPMSYQELLRLTVLAGRDEYRLIADVMRIPAGSAGPTRGRALDLLRLYLDEERERDELQAWRRRAIFESDAS